MDLEEAQRALNDANGRIAELEGQIAGLTVERDTASGRVTELETAQAALDARLAEAAGSNEAAVTALAEAQANGLTYLRRALLAEQAGQIVPELVDGADEASLLASVELAKQAYGRALDAARATLASQTVPAGAPSARVSVTAGLSPLAMIEAGLTSGR